VPQVSHCDPATQYQTAAATATKNEQCAPLTACTAAQFVKTAATSTSDRKCQAISGCNTNGAKTYTIHADSVTWATAEQKCQLQGEQLASFANQFELNTMLATSGYVAQNYWVGLQRSGGSFPKYTDGTAACEWQRRVRCEGVGAGL
jgi:hypothetical protein